MRPSAVNVSKYLHLVNIVYFVRFRQSAFVFTGELPNANIAAYSMTEWHHVRASAYLSPLSSLYMQLQIPGMSFLTTCSQT